MLSIPQCLGQLRFDWGMDYLPGGGVRVTYFGRDRTIIEEFTPEQAKAKGLWDLVSPLKPKEFGQGGESAPPMTVTKIDYETRTVIIE